MIVRLRSITDAGRMVVRAVADSVAACGYVSDFIGLKMIIGMPALPFIPIHHLHTALL